MSYFNTYLTLVEERVSKRGTQWLDKFVCVCGNEVLVNKYKVKTGHTKSCGCRRNELISAKNSKHGLYHHPIFKVWRGIYQRCYAEYSTKYPYYGAVGVRMCDEWRNNPQKFVDWAIANGWQKGLQIDKDIIPKKLGIPALLYCPELCSVVTNKQNCNERTTNKKFTYNGETKTISEWADFVGVDQKLMRYRIYKWGIKRAIETPLGIGNNTRIICETTGEIFESVIEAVRVNNVSRSDVYRVLTGKKEKTNGLVFKYLN